MPRGLVDPGSILDLAWTIRVALPILALFLAAKVSVLLEIWQILLIFFGFEHRIVLMKKLSTNFEVI